MTISANNMHFQDLNQHVRSAEKEISIDDCYGQRFIASGASGKKITINGTPGNALGAYLDGAEIHVNGNVQDAVGDTMNDGKIIVHGNAGDALGYAMRGGTIYVKGDSGYRTGIHMKEYKNKKPVIVIGGSVGSFLGEYLAGGVIIVLGIGADSIPVGHFTGTGMHGGRIYIRTNAGLDELLAKDLPAAQVLAEEATPDELQEIAEYTTEFAALFGDKDTDFLKDRFFLLKPNAKNPYKQLYTEN